MSPLSKPRVKDQSWFTYANSGSTNLPRQRRVWGTLYGLAGRYNHRARRKISPFNYMVHFAGSAYPGLREPGFISYPVELPAPLTGVRSTSPAPTQNPAVGRSGGCIIRFYILRRRFRCATQLSSTATTPLTSHPKLVTTWPTLSIAMGYMKLPATRPPVFSYPFRHHCRRLGA